jgi:hypothetical protein
MAAIQQAMLMNPYRFGDPSFANVSLQLHMDGSNGGTSFPDSSSNGHTVTPNSVTTSTAWSKFGGAAALISSATNQNRLTVPHHASFNVGAGEFTIEFWMRLTSVQTTVILTKSVGTGTYPYQVWISTDKIGFRMFAQGGTQTPNVVGATTLQTNTDYFVQCRRRNDGVNANIEIALNGVQDASTTIGLTYVLDDNTDLLSIGNFNSGAQFPVRGYMDDLRFTKGIARAWSLPTAAFPDS